MLLSFLPAFLTADKVSGKRQNMTESDADGEDCNFKGTETVFGRKQNPFYENIGFKL